MKQVYVRALLFWIVLLMFLVPIMSNRDYLLDTLIKSNANYLAQKAAVEGEITASLRQEVINNLQRVGFREDEITITFDTTVKERGERLDVIIQAKRLPSFPYNFGTIDEPEYYYAHTYVMSEYLD